MCIRLISSGAVISFINGIETEITSDDKEIVFKVFDYGYKEALKHHSSMEQ